jgi:glutamyl-tRNA synthetase
MVGIAPDETVARTKNLTLPSKWKKTSLQRICWPVNKAGYYYAFDTPEALDTFRKSEEEQGKHSYTIILTEKTRHFGNFYRRNG